MAQHSRRSTSSGVALTARNLRLLIAGALSLCAAGSLMLAGCNEANGAEKSGASAPLSDTSKEKQMDSTQANATQHAGVQVGDKAPDFTLPLYMSGKDPQDFTLSKAQGKTVVLYFYPKDDTPGCTKEACGLRDSATEYAKFNAIIVGVSEDDLDSHEAFATKYSLPFGLIFDKDGALRKQFGNPDGSEELIARITYIIDKDGVVQHIVGGEGVTVDDHLVQSHEWAEKLAPAAKP